ncbi:VG15 protein [Pseudoclavibacter terrae]|uniref:Minor capsid protein n=1 Tax=Pseudoclavibacter terrae TaxID=1530195 RepID=A0A7J5B6N4_9MICO|nr:hypothetical protein [Pseudoclavibacter terrae]KAB1639859.1 hypothetical protein F8O03_06000 [Pseudoclavibacter terrae]
MTDRSDLLRYQSALDEAMSLARGDLDEVVRAILSLPPEQARDELLAVLPGFTEVYGNAVAVAAAEWYEDVRRSSIGGTYRAQLGPTAPLDKVEASTRFAAGHLFTDTPEKTGAVLSGAVQRYVAYAGRSTVARNSQIDRRRPRFARVPKGATTCAWCSMLASRGFVYNSRESAGPGDDFHDDCNCQIVPSFDAGEVHFDGYDPDLMYDRYQAARAATGVDSPGQKQIVFELRRLYPDDFTDGVHDHA